MSVTLKEEESNTKPAPKPGTGFSFITILLILALNIAVSVLSIYYYDQHYAMKIVALDTKSYIENQKMLYLKGKISEKDLLASVDNIDSTLKSLNNNTVVLLGDAVVRNVEKIKIK